jgi:hypothetical protein
MILAKRETHAVLGMGVAVLLVCMTKKIVPKTSGGNVGSYNKDKADEPTRMGCISTAALGRSL